MILDQTEWIRRPGHSAHACGPRAVHACGHLCIPPTLRNACGARAECTRSSTRATGSECATCRWKVPSFSPAKPMQRSKLSSRRQPFSSRCSKPPPRPAPLQRRLQHQLPPRTVRASATQPSHRPQGVGGIRIARHCIVGAPLLARNCQLTLAAVLLVGSFIRATQCTQNNMLGDGAGCKGVFKLVSPVTGEAFAVKLVARYRSSEAAAKHTQAHSVGIAKKGTQPYCLGGGWGCCSSF